MHFDVSPLQLWILMFPLIMWLFLNYVWLRGWHQQFNINKASQQLSLHVPGRQNVLAAAPMCRGDVNFLTACCSQNAAASMD